MISAAHVFPLFASSDYFDSCFVNHFPDETMLIKMFDSRLSAFV
jgi:hypothetical protein